eukprot:940329-Pyramimonas_sp.AAC.1
MWSREAALPTRVPPFVDGKGFTPPPSPFPWTWTGRPARCQMVRVRTRWFQQDLGEPKVTSKMAQDNPLCLKSAPNNMLQEAPITLQGGSTTPPRPPRGHPRSQNHYNT